MAEKRVGIRELKARLSEYIREIKKGNTVVITQRGHAVGRIIPACESLDERIQSLVQSGVADWNGKKLKPGKPVAKIKPGSKSGHQLFVRQWKSYIRIRVTESLVARADAVAWTSPCGVTTLCTLRLLWSGMIESGKRSRLPLLTKTCGEPPETQDWTAFPLHFKQGS